MRKTSRNELLHNERLEQLYRHLLRKSALVYLHFGTYDDNRTAGVVDSLSEKVLSETSLLSLQHIRKRLQRSVSGAGHGTSAAAVVYKRVDCLLEHPLFVSDNDVGSSELKEPF